MGIIMFIAFLGLCGRHYLA